MPSLTVPKLQEGGKVEDAAAEQARDYTQPPYSLYNREHDRYGMYDAVNQIYYDNI